MKNKKLKKYLLITVVIMIFFYLQFSFVNSNIDFTKWSIESRTALSFIYSLTAVLSTYVFLATDEQ